VETLGCSVQHYKIGSLRYDLSKLRAKGLVDKLPHSRRYQLTPNGYRLCVVYLKLFEKFYAPLAAAIAQPRLPTLTFLWRRSALSTSCT
jgi:hypothetical protein